MRITEFDKQIKLEITAQNTADEQPVGHKRQVLDPFFNL